MDQMAFDPPPQPGPNCRISNWRGSVSGKRNHFATAYPLENIFRSSPKAELSESAATFQLVPTKSRSTSILWYRLPPTKEPQRCQQWHLHPLRGPQEARSQDLLRVQHLRYAARPELRHRRHRLSRRGRPDAQGWWQMEHHGDY